MEIDISKLEQIKVDGVIYLRASEVCKLVGFTFRSTDHLKKIGVPEEWILNTPSGNHPKCRKVTYVTQEALIYLIITNPINENNINISRGLASLINHTEDTVQL